MVCSAIVRQLQSMTCWSGAPAANVLIRTHAELDLTNQAAVSEFFNTETPTQVYMAAAKVGGIYANNTYPADFIYQNLMMHANVINSAFKCGVQKLLFLGSSCIYPRIALQPMDESALLTGPLGEHQRTLCNCQNSRHQALRKLQPSVGAGHGIDYRCNMLTSLNRPSAKYHPQNSQVIPALIRRLHEAKVNYATTITRWAAANPSKSFCMCTTSPPPVYLS